MDSTGLQSSNSVPSKRGIKRKASKMIQSRRAQFFANYKSQNFSLPDSVMFYMVTNPTSSEVYQKIIQTCKYFYVKNPILVISDLDYCGDGKWKLSSVKRPTDLSKIISKLWIIIKFFAEPENSVSKKAVKQNILSCLIPKLYRCDAKCVSIKNQNISFNDISLLFSSAVLIYFYNITVKDENGTNVAVEKIIEIAVKAKDITFVSDTIQQITSETMKNLLNIPHFLKLDQFHLNNIPKAFNLETFYSYMKINKTTKFRLCFHDSIFETYKNRLEEIIDEILATETHDYRPPFIHFDGVDEEKSDELFYLLHSFY